MNVNAVASAPLTVRPVVLRSTSAAAPGRVQATPENAAMAPKVTTAAAAAKPAPRGPTLFRVSLGVDRDLNRVIVTVRHPKTGEVIAQSPPEQILNIAREIRDMLAPVVDENV